MVVKAFILNLLEVNNLSKSFKDFQAVKELSFSIEKGDVYGFLGPNGAGKSTTLRMILGLIYPSSGEIKFRGEVIQKNSRKYLQHIGALIERPDFYENLSAWNNLNLFAQLAKVENRKSRIQEVLEEVKLWDRRGSRVKSYSQGMKQRLGIAQALLHKPELIILDEPSNGLDPQGQSDMRQLIKRINKDMGITVIISSHILAEIELIANRMLIINKGQKLKEGGVHELMGADDLKIELKSNDTEKLQQWLGDHNYNVELMASKIRVKLAENEIPDLMKKLGSSGLSVYEIKQLRTLEEYFINLTK
ncbi:MAG: ABC transporter ATP-binding protein [Flavobacteriales bacterium]|nr:ABC transporter ATP-binding protein [Flavobacteriales bacterium]